MGFVVNLTAFLILLATSFLLLRQAIHDLDHGLAWTLFFILFVVVFFVYLARQVFFNIFDRRQRESLTRFIDPRSNAQIRGQPDRILKSVSWLGMVSWASLMALIITLKEGLNNPLEKNASWIDGLSQSLDPKWRHYAAIFSLISLLVSGLGLFLKSRRNNRKGDRYPPSLIVIFIVSVLLFIILS
ncbi:MAG: hypothetical protein HQL78_02985 [Magnetococcales bacterium]|nr:hypothetical protein [Magnetococcales bacterium]